MRHCQKKRKFGRPRGQRQALLKNLAAHLILKEKITTTEAKAKEIRPFVEKLITKGRKNDLAAVKYLTKYLPVKARQKLISQISPRYQKRSGGYTRIVKSGSRQTDGAKMAIIELVK
jgi:large subunit ribosomal protein L17